MADSNAGSLNEVAVQSTTIDGAAGEGIKISGDVNIVTLPRLDIKNNDSYGIYLDEATETSPRLDLSSSIIHGNANYGVFIDAANSAGFWLRRFAQPGWRRFYS